MPFCERADRRIHYAFAGGGPGVVLVPGIGAGARLFGTLPRRFARAGFACAAVDPVGIQPSSPLRSPFTFAAAAADLLAVCSRLEPPVTLIGTSFGGKVAVQAAAQRADRLAGLVLLSSSVRVTARARAVFRWFEVLAQRLDDRQLGTALAPFLFGSSFHERHPEVVRDILRAVRPRAEARTLMAAQARALPDYDGTALAPRVRLPVLCLAGSEDTLTPPGEVAATAALFPDGRFEEVPQAGHSLLLESPRTFEAILEFIRSPG